MDYIKLRKLLDESVSGKRDHIFAGIPSVVHCMSTPRVYAMLNAVVSSMEPGEMYLEVGTYQGGSLISALQGNDVRAVGVDDFHEFNTTNSYDKTLDNLAKFGVNNRVTLHNMSYNKYFAEVIKPDQNVAVYYYDGAHSYEEQLAGLEAGWPYLQPGSIVIVDDYSYPPVVNSLNQFVENHKGHLRYLFAMATLGAHEDCHPTWWNGVMILQVI